VNFYKHHIGDYDADTAHLSWVEDAAYRRLICLYYRREQPVPADIAQACRLVRATSTAERKAVETVLHEFFQFSDDGWRHKRCDEEIDFASKQAEKNRENGKSGGRPRKVKTEPEPKKNPAETQVVVGETEFGNLSQTPDSKTPRKENPPTPKGDVRFQEFWTAWPKSPRKGGRPECLKVWESKALDAEADAILAHVRALSATDGWTKAAGEFVPAPVVYLRGRRWDGAELSNADRARSGDVFAGAL
jgi:uncharacterized protein YdaU (DUF1376 family)